MVCVKRGLAKVETDFFPRPAGGFDDVYNRKTADAIAMFQRLNDIRPTGHFGQATLDVLEPYFDAYARLLYLTFRAPEPAPLPDLGPVTQGGKSLIDMSLTHATHGLLLFPAVDLAWGAGVDMFAPEDVTVDTKDTSANPGEALYLRGVSGIRHWVAHIDRDYPLGTEFEKGDFLGQTVPTTVGGGPHGHWGINVEALLGKGEQLMYGRDGNGPDYTLGASTVGDQLRKALA